MAFVYVGQRRPDQKQSTKWQSINGVFPLCHWRSTSYLVLILCLATNGNQARHQSQPNAPSATPATPNADRQVPRLPRKTQVDVSSATPATQMELRCHQVPRLPPKVQVDIGCQPCHAQCRAAPGATITGHKRATRPSPCAISATPAAQSAGGCRQGRRLPPKKEVDVSKCHTCHAKCRWMSQVPRQSCVWQSCVWQRCVWQRCVWQSCVWQRCVGGGGGGGGAGYRIKNKNPTQRCGKKLLLNPIKWSALSPRPERPRIQDPARIALRAMLWACWFGVALLAPSMKLEVFIGPSKLSRTVTHIYNIFI